MYDHHRYDSDGERIDIPHPSDVDQPDTWGRDNQRVPAQPIDRSDPWAEDLARIRAAEREAS